MSKKEITYNIGLDIGTNSVGWAVTDMQNNLLKFKGKNMWGVRLFEAGETAANRRVFRSTRRRLARRKQRIKLLQTLTEQTVLESDESFFIRMQESMLHLGDRVSNKEKSNLFVGDFSDKNYFDKYPTIYHLREELISSNEKMDSRLIYLAMHHIIKYRGHFLHDGEFEVSEKGLESDLTELIDSFNEQLELGLDVPVKETIEILNNRQLKKGERIDAVIDLWNRPKAEKDFVKNLLSLLVGNKGTLSKIFIGYEIKDENDKAISIGFGDSKFEELEDSILGQLEDNANLLELIKKVYSGLVLFEVLNGEEFISKAMVNSYKKHKKDLSILKRLFKAEFSDSYFNFFRKEVEGKNYVKNYLNYINGEKRCNQEELYKALKVILQKKEVELSGDADFQYCIDEMERNSFLLKQNSKVNAAIPHQLGKYELERIIDNQSVYYPELKKNKENIILLLTFRIPYYVGPLNQESTFGWIEKIEGKEHEKVLPWNFEEVVNVDLTAEKFIEKMRNFCTYLPGEEVLPKYSLIHSRFQLLNELNGIRVDGKKLPVEVKNQLMQGLFLTTQTVKNNKFVSELNKLQFAAKEVTGYQKDGEFANSLVSEIKFNNILGEEYVSNNIEKVEEIIKWLALFEDRKILKRKIKDKYPEIKPEQRERIAKLNFNGWARLSRKLIDGIKFEAPSCEKKTILSIMGDTKENFMQVITNEKYGFDKIIENNREKHECRNIRYDDIKKLACSPAVKRGIWQTVGIVKEIIKVMKHEPANIYLEFAREDQVSKRTNSRFKQMEKLYQVMKDDVSFYNKEIFAELKSNKDQLDSEKLYLYFIQNGKCMYCCESFEISKLSNYEVDHIIPRTLIKDDSIENKVLVHKKCNQNKADSLILSESIRYTQRSYWNSLYKHKLIGNKKYRNLNRRHFDEKDIEGFINRQLVETRQISKNIAVLFQDTYSSTKINVVKAQLSSDFRKQFELYKLRDVNDYHHAHDAYLASLIGNYTKLRYPKIEKEIVYNDYMKFGNDFKARKGKFGFIVTSMMNDFIDLDTGEIIWKSDESVSKVRKTLNYKDCFVTKKLEENTGKFYNENASKKPIIKNLQTCALKKIKNNLDVRDYGGYGQTQNAYLTLIEYTVRKKRKLEIVGVPIYQSELIKNKKKSLEAVLEEEYGFEGVKVLKHKIYKNQLILFRGALCFPVNGGEVSNAHQMLASERYSKILHVICSSEESGDRNDDLNKKIDEFFAYFVGKLPEQYPLLKKEYTKLSAFLNEGRLEGMDFDKKKNLLKNLLIITKVNSKRINLEKEYKIKGDLGRIEVKVIPEDIVFIDQSITGMYEKRYVWTDLV